MFHLEALRSLSKKKRFCCHPEKSDQRASSYLGPAALLAQQVSVAVRLLPLLLVRVSPHQFPVTHVVDLLPLLLAADAFLVLHPGLQAQIHTTKMKILLLARGTNCVSFPNTYRLKVSSQGSNASRVEENNGALEKKMEVDQR